MHACMHACMHVRSLTAYVREVRTQLDDYRDGARQTQLEKDRRKQRPQQCHDTLRAARTAGGDLRRSRCTWANAGRHLRRLYLSAAHGLKCTVEHYLAWIVDVRCVAAALVEMYVTAVMYASSRQELRTTKRCDPYTSRYIDLWRQQLSHTNAQQFS